MNSTNKIINLKIILLSDFDLTFMIKIEQLFF